MTVPQSLDTHRKQAVHTVSRRELFRRSALLSLPALFRGSPLAAAPAATEAEQLRAGKDVYQSIGVRPLIKRRGTFTIIHRAPMLAEGPAADDPAPQRPARPAE